MRSLYAPFLVRKDELDTGVVRDVTETRCGGVVEPFSSPDLLMLYQIALGTRMQ